VAAAAALALALSVGQHSRACAQQPGGEEGKAAALQREFVKVAEKVSRSVVAVISDRALRGPRGSGRPPVASGVIFDASGLIVTNEHVVRGVGEVTIVTADGRRLKGKVTGADARSDLAVVKIIPDAPGAPNFVPIAWGDSDKVRIGQWAIAVGNPFGFSNTVTVGVVSGVKRPLPGWALESLRRRSGTEVYYGSLIQTDAAISPGNSGGALVDLEGRLVGINTLMGADIRTGAGVGFAIPANVVRKRVGDLKEGRRIRYGWLGVRLKDLAGPLAKAFGVTDGEGVLVDDVVPGSPAAKAGVVRGHVIRSFGGVAVGGTDQLVLLVGETKIDSVVELVLLDPRAKAGAKELKLKVTIGERRPAAPLGTEEGPPAEALLRGWRGVVLAEVEGAAGGVPIKEVQPGSPAARAGLVPGDRIDEIGTDAASMKAVNGHAQFKKAAAALGIERASLLHCVRLGYVVVEGKGGADRPAPPGAGAGEE